MSDDEGSDPIICPCPVCGEELAHLDEMWRQIHINGCLSREQPALLQRCQVERCPICNTAIGHLSADLATRHINECMDRNQRRGAVTRQTERCPFCGQSLRDLSDRQRRIHDQTCRKTDRVVEVDVVQYPKVVESLPTPEEWSIERRFEPQFVGPVEDLGAHHDIPLFGTVVSALDLQGISGYQLTNDPYTVVSPELCDQTRQV